MLAKIASRELGNLLICTDLNDNRKHNSIHDNHTELDEHLDGFDHNVHGEHIVKHH